MNTMTMSQSTVFADPIHDRSQDADGWRVLAAGLSYAKAIFADRLVSAYAIGSLAHGGFAPAVSDVDLALILDCVRGEDELLMQRIRERVMRELSTPLSQRLSLFWASWSDLRTQADVGRFPLVDRTDLVAHGVCVSGPDHRADLGFPVGSLIKEELLVECACFMLHKLASPERIRLLKQPQQLVQLGCRDVTKIVLYPARLLCTASTGRCAANSEVVTEALGFDDPELKLVRAALRWRTAGRLDSEPKASARLAAGLLPLYCRLVRTYRLMLAELRHGALVQQLDRWYCALIADSFKPSRASAPMNRMA
jgi:hypothetical protein